MRTEFLQKWNYINTMSPLLEKSALFSDGTKSYCEPAEPEPGDLVTIRFRTAKDNVDKVCLCTKDKPTEMEKYDSSKGFDYYFAVISVESTAYSYYFKIESGSCTCYYDRYGVSREIREEYAFTIMPGFSTPEWAKGAVMYQIMVDRFCNGDERNDTVTNEYYYIHAYSKKVEDWNQVPSSFSVSEFYGGDLEGVRQKLDYLKKLGVEVIYFNPLFVSPSNHKYDTQDYDYIDPHFGVIEADGGEILSDWVTDNSKATKYQKRVTDKQNLEASNRFFIRFVEEAHSHGIKVILDGVFNHCGSFNKWMDREGIYRDQEGYAPGAYVSGDSPYRDFFKFQDQNGWPYNNSYKGWWGHDTLPKLNYEESQNLLNYIMKIGQKWVSPPFNADGWRLDVAADLGESSYFNHFFWQRFRQAVKEANPDAVILAEHYGNAKEWLQGDQWDTVMNYDAFMEPLSWFLTGMEKHSDGKQEDLKGNYDAFEKSMRHAMAGFLTPSLYCAMNELSNHDHSRFLTRTNGMVGRAEALGTEAASQGINKAVFKAAVVFQMTWPGAPTIYYGDEAGLCGFTDPDNRRTYPWDDEDMDLLNFHRELIRIRKTHKVLRTGSLVFLEGENDVLAYGRFDFDEQIVVLINNSPHFKRKNISVWEAGISKEGMMINLISGEYEGFSKPAESCRIFGGRIEVEMPGNTALILKQIG